MLVIPTLVAAAALVFVLMRLIPGDICVVRLGSGGGNVDPGDDRERRQRKGHRQRRLEGDQGYGSGILW